MNKIYGIVFGQYTPGLQSVIKVVPDYENKSKDCDCLCIMEELKKITSGVYIKENPSLYLIEQLISFVNIYQGPSEINDEYLNWFNS